MSDSQMFLSSHLGLFYNDIKMSTNVLYRSVLYGKLYQGHPATIFCKITGAPNENIVQNHINIALLNVL